MQERITNLIKSITPSLDGNAIYHNQDIYQNLSKINDIIDFFTKTNTSMATMYNNFKTIFNTENSNSPYLPIQFIYGANMGNSPLIISPSDTNPFSNFDAIDAKNELSNITNNITEINNLITQINDNKPDGIDIDFYVSLSPTSFPLIELCIDIIDYFQTYYYFIRKETTTLYDYMPLIASNNNSYTNIYDLDCIIESILESHTTTNGADDYSIFMNTSDQYNNCLLYTSPSPRDRTRSRMPSSA